jgi:acyl-CoA synthetase (AMP-forming)/AMP-acid ligase II
VLNFRLEISLSGLGERVLMGPGLAHGCGYVGRPEATAKAFAPLTPQLEALDIVLERPQASGADGRPMMYRTGDLVRQMPSGPLEFLGRLEGYIKVRGHRIEPGEIEATLRSAEGVTEAIVVLVGDQIVAYVSGGGPTQELREHCSRFLPSHMMPNQLIPVQEWPRLNSGKIDRGALPKPPQRPWDVPLAPQERLDEKTVQVHRPAAVRDVMAIV